ncbi:hypothetical protein FRC12_013925 [Ceratobasidium sp. 428]|nr:hypothetical protein FRC12_013925 [Ceratobasidium sp. 428]
MSLSFSSGVEPLKKETNPLSLLQEWKAASMLLAASLERYVNECHRIKDVQLNLAHALGNTSQIWDMFDDMDEELARLESYPSKLRQARVEVSVARNRSPKLAPIMDLPQELLAHIFELVLFAEYRDRFILDEFDYAGHKLEPLMHPNILSSVCTYWRQVATNTPSLWVHIDLSVSGEHKEKYYARASRFIRKASNALLFVRIHHLAPSDPNDVQQLTTWLAPIVGQIYSLNIFIGNPLFKETLGSVLQCWLEHGTPGTVKELSFLCYGFFHDLPRWLIKHTSASNPTSSQLNVSSERFEEFFQPIVFLRLEGSFPPWRSQAYHGLVYLHLGTGYIEEVELIDLLSLSPRLRTLCFGIPIVDTRPRNTPIIPVPLPLLEILSLTRMNIDSVWSLLRLVAPGSGPLKLSLGNDFSNSEDSFTQIEEVQAFIQRSNITTAHLTGRMDSGDIWFPKTCSDFPQLHTLTLNQYSLCNYVTDVAENLFEAICPSLRELCLVRCELEINLLVRLLRTHSIQVLRIAGCTMLIDNGPMKSLEELEHELFTLIPNVKNYEDCKGGYSDFYLNWKFDYL